MKACLATGAYCMIDVHNFARWDGGIIGQGGPDDDVFVDLWLSLANRYLDEERVIFGLMNEPHDLDVDVWAQTCQKVVTAVRGAGAASQMILLPGTNFTNALTFVSTGSAEALARITNPDGGQDGLVMDLHKYLDENNSGSFAECVTDNVDAFETVGQWLRQNKRMGMISETGASSDPSVSKAPTRPHRYPTPFPPVVLTIFLPVHGRLLRAEQVHQPKLRRLPGLRRLGRRQLRHLLPAEPDAHRDRWQVGGQRAVHQVHRRPVRQGRGGRQAAALGARRVGEQRDRALHHHHHQRSRDVHSVRRAVVGVRGSHRGCGSAEPHVGCERVGAGAGGGCGSGRCCIAWVGVYIVALHIGIYLITNEPI